MDYQELNSERETEFSDQFRFLDENELSTSAELSETTKCE